MKTSRMKTTMLLLLTASAMMLLPGCAAKKEAGGNLSSGKAMKYGYAPGNDYRYQNTYEFEQEFEMMGQQVKVTANGDQILKMEPKKSSEEKLDLLVTVENMHALINSPGGEMKADLDGVIGKSFNFSLSPDGRELEFAEAEDLKYGFGTGESKTIASDVQGFFPDLPDHPVKPGDTWESRDHITESAGKNSMVMDIINFNTFENFETYNGYECMKVNYTFTGTISGEGEQDDAKITTSGDLEGTGTWYFAFKEGIFIHQSVEGQGNTITQVKGPREMTLPATRKYTMATSLIGR